MARSPEDRRRSLLAGAALMALALAAVSLRAVKAAAVVAAKPTPVVNVAGLSEFLQPLRDSSVLAHVASATMVVARDPFALPGVGVPVVTPTGAARPTTGGGQYWVVSSILFEGSRRSAIVNNAWVTVGDALGGGSRLTAIESNFVVVTDASGVRHVVPIQGGEL